MAARKHQPKEPKESAVEMAIGALDGNPNPLDMDMSGIDPDPTSLDLGGDEDTKVCLHFHTLCTV